MGRKKSIKIDDLLEEIKSLNARASREAEAKSLYERALAIKHQLADARPGYEARIKDINARYAEAYAVYGPMAEEAARYLDRESKALFDATIKKDVDLNAAYYNFNNNSASFSKATYEKLFEAFYTIMERCKDVVKARPEYIALAEPVIALQPGIDNIKAELAAEEDARKALNSEAERLGKEANAIWLELDMPARWGAKKK